MKHKIAVHVKKLLFLRKKFIKHHVQYHVLNMKKVDFFKKDNYKTWVECSEKWPKYYTCKECEDKVNRKGHLTKPREAVHVGINKNNF